MTTASDRLRTGLLTRWPGRAALLILFAALLIGAVLVQNGEITLPERRQVIDPAELRHEEGHCYILNVHILPCDGTGVSQLELYEDGTRLGPPHTLHDDIRAEGEGRYSHKNERLRFAASDNSDPRDNGRTYTMVYPGTVPAWVVPVLAAVVIGLGLPYLLTLASPSTWRRAARRGRSAVVWLTRFDAQSPEGRRVRAMLGSLAALTVLAFAAMLAMHMEVLPAPERRVAIDSSDLREEEGHCWIMHLDVEPCDGTGTSRLVLYEDGQPLGPAHSSHADIRAEGEGRYSHKNERLRFAASDNSDPTANGRAYVIEYPVLPPPWLWWTVGIAAAALSAPWLWRWRTSDHWPVRPFIIHSIITVLLLSMVTWNAVQEVDDESLSSDGGQYLRMGLNLYRHGVVSLSNPDSATIEPTSYREPIVPVYAALSMYALPSFSGDEGLDEIYEGPLLEQLKYAQIVLLLTICLGSLLAARLLTGSMWPGYAAMVLVGFAGAALTGYVNTVSTELAAAALLVFLSTLLWRSAQAPRVIGYLLLGLCLGVLVLTRAVFLYAIVLVVLAIIYALWSRRFNGWAQALGCVLAFALVYGAVVGGWCARNWHHFDSFKVTLRGGAVLVIRTEMNDMTRDEFIGSFYAWSRNSELKTLLGNRLGYSEEDLEAGGRLERLNRSLDHGFYQTGRRRRGELWDEYSEHPNGTQLADERLKELAVQRLKDHPLKHLRTSIALAWRGHFVEDYWYFSQLYWLCFVGFLGWAALRRSRWPLIFFLLPTLYVFGMHTLFSHSIPRYNQPAIPVLAVTAVVLAFWISRAVLHCIVEHFSRRDPPPSDHASPA